jgi:hypothetical protein
LYGTSERLVGHLGSSGVAQRSNTIGAMPVENVTGGAVVPDRRAPSKG